MKLTVEMIDAGARAIYAHEPFTWGDDSHVYETIATADRAQLRAIAAVAIEAAIAVAPDPAPDDAFADALDELCDLAADAECNWQMRDWDSWEGTYGTFHAARQRILALHRQAKQAGLRELRAWCVTTKSEPGDEFDQWVGGYESALEHVIQKIDAMLTEETDG